MYQAMSSFAQTWGLLFFMALFLAVVIYALWPKNRGKFDRMARLPLEDDDAGPLAAEPEAEPETPESKPQSEDGRNV